MQGNVLFWLRTNAWEFEKVPKTSKEVDVRQPCESEISYRGLPEDILELGKIRWNEIPKKMEDT